MARHTETIEVITRDQRRRRWSLAEKAALVKRTYEPGMSVSLYMAAVVAKRINPDVKALYERLCANGKSKMAALGACMRKLVHLCYGVEKSGRAYEPQISMSIQAK